MRIQMIGAGSWGLALARLLALNGHEVAVNCRKEDKPEEMQRTRRNETFMPGIDIPESITFSSKDYHQDAELAVYAVPSHVMRKMVKRFDFDRTTVHVNVAKGIENDSLKRMSEVILEEAGPCAAVTLSGPTHAEEVCRGMPASIVAAGKSDDACAIVQDAFMCDSLRVYTSHDIVGVELGGSLKNVIAIAAGVSDGLGLGDNAKAALITRGLHEMSKLGMALGAEAPTFAGLSGMGDLIVTCMSRHSRNRHVGECIGQGQKLDDVLRNMAMVAEGVRTAQSVYMLARREKVEMPISEEVYAVLFDNKSAHKAIADLMTRDAKHERA